MAMEQQQYQNQDDSSSVGQKQLQHQTRLLLVWPTNTSSLSSTTTSRRYSNNQVEQRPQQLGLCIGWKTTAPSSDWPVTTIIVAGIILNDEQPQSSLHKHLQVVTRRVKQMQQQCCYCCTCSSGGPRTQSSWRTAMPCTGCTRRLCFEELTVVACLSGDRSTTGFASSQQGGSAGSLYHLPRITLSPDGLPRFQRIESTQNHTKAQEVLLYDGSDGITLYRHVSSLYESPFFSKTLLTRMTHASTVVGLLQASDAASTKTATNDDATRERLSEPSKFQHATEPTTITKAYNFLPLDLLRKHSLLFRHFFATRRDPTRLLIPLADLAYRVYVVWKKRGTAGNDHHSCPSCRQRLVIRQSLYEASSKAIAESDAWTLVVVDVILGILMGVALFHRLYHQSDWKDSLTTAIQSHHQLLSNGLQWLERFPIGFKLNESLTENVGREIQRLWHVHEWTMLRLVADSAYLQPLFVMTFALVSCLFGASGLMALCFDSSRLLSLHISMIAFCTQRVYIFELYLLASLWRLFRGKKRNILRHRTDTMQYDSMQSLLGTILFAIALFLFTTIFVYQAYFAFLYLLTAIIPITLGVIYSLLHCFPLGSLSQRFRRPKIFTREVFFLEEQQKPDPHHDSDYCACRVAMRPVAYSRIILDHISFFLQSSLSWCLSFATCSLSGRCSYEDIIDATHKV